jgi:hypothetical protein
MPVLFDQKPAIRRLIHAVTLSSSKQASLLPLDTDTELVMLHAENQDRLYLISHSDEQQALVGGLAFNVQDRHWLVYCALGGHQHADLPETDLLTGVSMLDFYVEAA